MAKHWRLWHRLFGWDYAQVNGYSRTEPGNVERIHILRVRKTPDGRRYVDFPCAFRNNLPFEYKIAFLDNCEGHIPLTWVSEDDTFKSFGKIVEQKLLGEDV